ncbi:hypothetical protein A6R68_13665 [Neotoma lepida]|uniref:Uncharacterized protein n=1 Tax=Neotoma lepida TaxID=56216 RepID=A0A1A6GZJ8_NEOLE|nr:hypothetical protein A6R68_13665 [Neotoma lepida]
MSEEDYAFAMWDWRTLNPMTSGCFTWITDFDQLVGVKRINTEWIHLQVTWARTLTGQIITSSMGQKKHHPSASEMQHSIGASQRT